jgi:hypothetical protein
MASKEFCNVPSLLVYSLQEEIFKILKKNKKKVIISFQYDFILYFVVDFVRFFSFGSGMG